MKNLAGKRSRSGFVEIEQTDTDDHSDNNGAAQQRLSGAECFRERVQRVFRQAPVAAPRNVGLLNAYGSPALSDTTLVGDDYMSLPAQQFDEVDLTEANDRFAAGSVVEVVGHYGPAFGSSRAVASDTYKTKVGDGIEVRVESYPVPLSPSGLHVDDSQHPSNYLDSERITEKLSPISSAYDYKPVPLRWRFILLVFGGFVTLLVLSELSLHLLPNASDIRIMDSAFQNISEIRKRADTHNDGTRQGPSPNTTEYIGDTQAGVTTGPDPTSTLTEANSTINEQGLPTPDEHTPENNIDTGHNKDDPGQNSPSPDDPSNSAEVTDGQRPGHHTVPENNTNHTSPTDQRPDDPWDPVGSTPGNGPGHHNGAEHDTNDPTQGTPGPNNPSNPTGSTHRPEHGSGHGSEHHDTTEQDPNNPNEDTPDTDGPSGPASPTGPADPTHGHGHGHGTSTAEGDVSTSASWLDHHSNYGNPTHWPMPGQHTSTDNSVNEPSATDPAPGQDSNPTSAMNYTQTESVVTPTPGGQDQAGPSTTQSTATPHKNPNSLLAQFPHDTTDQQQFVAAALTTLAGPVLRPTSSAAPRPDATTASPLAAIILDDPGAQTGGNPSGQGSNHPPGGQRLGSPIQSTQQAQEKSGNQTQDQQGNKAQDQSKHQPTSQLTQQAEDTPLDRQPEPTNDEIKSPSLINLQAVTKSSWTSPTAGVAKPTSDVRTDPVETSKPNVKSPSTTPAQQTKYLELDENNIEPFTTITLTPDAETPPPTTKVFTTSLSVAEGSIVEVTRTTTIAAHIKAAEPLSESPQTITYANGTVGTLFIPVYDSVTLVTGPDGISFLHVLRSAQATTLKDPLGTPTATVNFFDIPSTITLYDSNYVATATITTNVAETIARTTTLQDKNGIPTRTVALLEPISISTRSKSTGTPTSTVSAGSNGSTMKVKQMSDGIYFVGLMLPTLLAIFVSITMRIFSRNVKLYQGFHLLASDRGATAAESLCLNTTGPSSLLNVLRSFQTGNYLLGLTSVLVALSALTIPFSTEVFRLILQGPQCHPDQTDELECYVTLGVFPAPAHVLSALLIVLIVGMIAVALLFRRWRSGVKYNPWSISRMAQLAAGTDMRKVLERLHRHHRTRKNTGTKEFVNRLGSKTLGLGEWEENGVMKYSVLILTREEDDVEENSAKKAGRSVAFGQKGGFRWKCTGWPSGDFVPFFALSWIGRILFLLLLSGVLIAVLIYEIVARGSEYQRGLTGKAVGVRFLFSGAGVIVTLAWGSFFDAVAFLSPYKLLQRRRLDKGSATNLCPATDPFTGLWLTFVPSRRDLYLGVVAATAILSEVLPLYLGNIPCNGVQIERAETICVYLSVAVLSIMIFTVGASFFIDWPTTMGADPSTIAGAMYAAHVLSVEQPLTRFFGRTTYGV